MCNIAGYVGSKPAAPILIEMMKKQEGWGGGFYTGIATIHEGKIYHAKITGDVKRMLDYTDAAKLPGTIGILHSRSKSGGDDLWSHPFVGAGGHTAYVANGSYGIFADEPYISERTKLFGELEELGYHSRSRTLKQVGRYPTCPDGSSAHMSDIMAQFITKLIDDGLDASEAMNKAFCEMPSEIVGLTIYDKEPDAIIWSKINQPMNAGYADHGCYLATTAQAFPEDARNITMLPSNSGGRVYADRFTVTAYTDPPCTVAPITDKVINAAYDRICEVLSDGKPRSIGILSKEITDLFDEAECTPRTMVAYRVLKKLEDEGRLKREDTRVSGMLPTISAPHFNAYFEV
nr:hypothetical protein [Clostridia bacterium]